MTPQPDRSRSVEEVPIDEIAHALARRAEADLPDGWRLLFVTYSPEPDGSHRTHFATNVDPGDLLVAFASLAREVLPGGVLDLAQVLFALSSIERNQVLVRLCNMLLEGEAGPG